MFASYTQRKAGVSGAKPARPLEPPRPETIADDIPRGLVGRSLADRYNVLLYNRLQKLVFVCFVPSLTLTASTAWDTRGLVDDVSIHACFRRAGQVVRRQRWLRGFLGRGGLPGLELASGPGSFLSA